MKIRFLTCFSFWIILLSMHCSNAQPGTLDTSFRFTFSGYGEVRALAQQTDGKILAGIQVVPTNPYAPSKVLRLFPDGTIDSSFVFARTTNYIIRDMEVQADGKILVAGDFDLYDSVPAGRIFRLNPNGTPDSSFQTGSGFDAGVYSLKLQPDGKILAGGLFTSYNGSFCNHLVRLWPNGQIDTTFDTRIGANRTVEKVLLQPDGKILIAGDFTSYAGDYCLRLARVHPDGSRDSSFTALPGASSVVFAMALQNNGSIVIGGNFSQYDFQNRTRIARVFDNGQLDPQFYVNQGANSQIKDLALLSNNRVLIAGEFTEFKNYSANRIVLTDSFCAVDTTFNDLGTGANETIYKVLIQPDGKILISGGFTQYNGIPLNRIARLYQCLTPQPDSIYGSDFALCRGTIQTYSVSPVNGATRYHWTLPNGWTGSSDSASISIISNGSGGVISVRAFTDSCGWSYAETRTIRETQTPGVNLCLVTVDDQSTHNVVIWEKPLTNTIDSFFIYRETTSNVYTKVGALGYNDYSEFHDDTFANPNLTNYRYKLSVLDTCGVESEQSVFHSTIHLQNMGNGNFQWTFYQIEPGINPVISFNVYRDNFGNGNFLPIGFVPGTNSTFTDLNFNAYNNSVYVVDVNWGISCTPGRAVSTTRSNKRPKKFIDFPPIVGMEMPAADQIELYPNPASAQIHLKFPTYWQISEMQLLNPLGQILWSGTSNPIPVHAVEAGIYFLQLETRFGRIIKKVMIE